MVRKPTGKQRKVKAGDYVDWGDLRISFWNPPGKLEIGHQPKQKNKHNAHHIVGLKDAPGIMKIRFASDRRKQ